MSKKIKQTEIKRILKQFRSDREEVLEATTVQAWREWVTSPYFWFYWAMSNISSSDIATVAEWVMTKDRKDEFWDICDTIKDVYNNPIKWIKNEDYSIRAMIERHGQPE